MSWSKSSELFDAIVSHSTYSERKGKKMIYCSSNGYMYFILTKDGEIGFRLNKADQKEFGEAYGFEPLISYGATMKDYVKIPVNHYTEVELLAKWLDRSHVYVNTLTSK